MAKGRRKNKIASSLGVILDVVEVVDTTFERLTGKSIASWLREFQQQPRELPQGEQAVPQQPAMPLADAYAIMGVEPNSCFDEIKKRYRVLANLFHPDKGGYVEAMKLLNVAYERIRQEKGS